MEFINKMTNLGILECRDLNWGGGEFTDFLGHIILKIF